MIPGLHWGESSQSYVQHGVSWWIRVLDTALQLHGAEDDEDGAQEGNAVEDSDESEKDSVAEVVAVGLVRDADAEHGGDQKEDSKGTDGGREPNKEMAPEAQLFRIQ